MTHRTLIEDGEVANCGMRIADWEPSRAVVMSVKLQFRDSCFGSSFFRFAIRNPKSDILPLKSRQSSDSIDFSGVRVYAFSRNMKS